MSAAKWEGSWLRRPAGPRSASGWWLRNHIRWGSLPSSFSPKLHWMGGKAAGSRKGRERGAAWSTAASRWKQKPEGTGRSTPGQRGSALPRPRSSSQSLHEEPGKRDGIDSSAPPPTAGRGGGGRGVRWEWPSPGAGSKGVYCLEGIFKKL